MILELQQALKDDGVFVSLVKLCGWFGVPRRTVYYKPTKVEPKVQDQFVKPIKAMIEENPSFAHEQEHRPARVPDHGLAGSQTACGVPSKDSGSSLCRCCAE
jgi:hypothetical protein